MTRTTNRAIATKFEESTRLKDLRTHIVMIVEKNFSEDQPLLVREGGGGWVAAAGWN